MKCPSCGSVLTSTKVRYCGKCGSRILLSEIAWILRRAIGGFITGATGWLFAQAVMRILNVDSSIPQPLFGLFAGGFLGGTGGILEHSVMSSFKGFSVGALSGGFAYFIGKLIFENFPQISKIAVGALIGNGIAIGVFSGSLYSSSRFSSKQKSIFLIIVCLVGVSCGGLANFIGWEMNIGLILQLQNPNWIEQRIIELIEGAIFGGTLWFCFALLQRMLVRLEII